MATTTSLGFSIFSTYNDRGTRKAEADLKSLSGAVKSLGTIAKGAAIAAGAFGSVWVAQAVKMGIVSNALTQRTNKAVTTLLGSSEAAAEQMAELREFGKESPFPLPVWLAAQQRLLAFGTEAKNVVPTLEAVQNAVIAAGGTTEELNGVILAMGQIEAKGKLSAEELNQMGERGVNAAQIVATAMGTTQEEIRSQITAGAISVDQFFEAFRQGSQQLFGDAAAGFRETFSGMTDRLAGVKRRIGEVLATPFVDPDGGGAFVEIGNAVADTLNIVEEELRNVTFDVSAFTDTFVNGIKAIGDAIDDGALSSFITRIREASSAIVPLIAGLGASGLAGALSRLPGPFAAVGAAINPFAAAAIGLVAVSPELQSSLAELLGVAVKLVQPFTDLALIFATGISTVLDALLPIISGIVSAFVSLSDAITPLGALLAVGLVTGLAAIALGFTTASAAVGVFGRALLMLGAVVLAHPVLAIGALVAVIVGFFASLDSNKDKVDEWANVNTEAFQRVGQGAFSLKTAFAAMDTAALTESLLKYNEALNNNGEVIVGTTKHYGLLGVNAKELNETMKLSEEEMAKLAAKTDELDQAMAKAVNSGQSSADVQREVKDALGLTWTELNNILPSLDSFQAASDAAAAEQQELANNTNSATAALVAQTDQMLAQVDPLFALISAEQQLKTAQEAANVAIRTYGADSTEAKNATIAAGQALSRYIATGKSASSVLGSELSPSFIAAAGAAGFTSDIMSVLTGQTNSTTAAFQSFAKDWEATARVNDQASGAANNIRNSINNIPSSKTVSIFVRQIGDAAVGIRERQAFANGGPVRGPGTGTSDSITARLSNGEHVLTKREVDSAGGHSAIMRLRESIRNGKRFANGGPVGGTSGVASAGIVINFNGPVADRRGAEDMVVQAITDAQRKGRIRI